MVPHLVYYCSPSRDLIGALSRCSQRRDSEWGRMQAILAQAGEDCVGCRGRSKVVHQAAASILLRCIDVQLLFSEDMFFKHDYVSTSLEDDARRREIWLGKSPVGDMSAAVSSCGCAGRTVWLRIFLERVLPTPVCLLLRILWCSLGLCFLDVLLLHTDYSFFYPEVPYGLISFLIAML